MRSNSRTATRLPHPHWLRHFSAVVGASTLALVTVALAPGCRSARVATTMPAEVMGGDEDAQMDFWHTLPDQRLVGNDAAFHALLLFLDGADPNPDYASRVEALRSRKLLPGGFNAPADAAVTRGTLAVAFARALDIKGGLTMTIFGPTQRYATRELQYVGLFPASDPHQTFTGQELLGIIGRAEDYRRLKGTQRQLKPHEDMSVSDLVGTNNAPAATTEPATTNPFDNAATNPPARTPATPAPGAPVRE